MNKVYIKHITRTITRTSQATKHSKQTVSTSLRTAIWTAPERLCRFSLGWITADWKQKKLEKTDQSQSSQSIQYTAYHTVQNDLIHKNSKTVIQHQKKIWAKRIKSKASHMWQLEQKDWLKLCLVNESVVVELVSGIWILGPQLLVFRGLRRCYLVELVCHWTQALGFKGHVPFAGSFSLLPVCCVRCEHSATVLPCLFARCHTSPSPVVMDTICLEP